jgi:tungstate transport system ATP-binding protein
VPLGLYSKIQVDCGFVITAFITNQSVKELALITGKKITAAFKATAVHVIKCV